MPANRRAKLLPVLLCCSALVLPVHAIAQALPTGGQVTAGSASIGRPAGGNVTVNQNSQRAVVNWQNFNVGTGNSVTINQPNANAAILNRVTGTGGSNIAGSINANGKVYLVNPNGIQIAPTGNIDAKGGFIASTLGVSNRDFMAGKDSFAGKGASKGVVNQGTITTGQGGTVALIGGSVSNEGTITAPLGKVALGAGETATLDVNGDGFLQVAVPSDATDASGKPLVSNSGKIDAAGGMVELKAAAVRDAMRQAVNMSGTIQARSVSGYNGQVVLGDGSGATIVSGKVDVSGPEQGGRIDVAGSKVELRGATLDASGGDQGGLVRVGGAFQGGRVQDPATPQTQQYVTRFAATPAIASADATTVDANSTIRVSATKADGAGGTAIVWSNLNTIEQGIIDARGAGVGGAVEVSSHNAVQSVGLARITTGRGGALLLDPKNINIVDDPGDGSITFDTAQNYAFADSIGGTLTLSTQDVMGVLSTGTNLTLQASNDITWTTGGGAGNGTLGHLTLDAGRSVIFNIATQLDFLQGTVTVIANDTAAAGVVDADRDSGAANLSIIASGTAINGGIANAINGGYTYTPSSPSSYLTLKLLDGAGNTNHDAGNLSITQASFSDIELYAAPAAHIDFYDQTFLARNLTLTGNIQIVQSNTFGISADDSFNWTNEYTAGISTLDPRTLSFNIAVGGFNTREGRIRPGDTDAVRLDIAGDTVPYTAVYGDSIPTVGHSAVVTIDAQSAIQSFGSGDTAASIVRTPLANFLQNPGDPVGTYAGTIGVIGSLIRSGGHASYLANVSTFYSTALTLNITPRPVTVMATDASGFTYGQPNGAVAVTLLPDESNGGAVGAVGILSGDNAIPVVSYTGISGTQSLDDLGNLQFAFGNQAPGGTHAYTVTGLSNSNYAISLVTGTRSAQLTVSPALLTPTVSPGSYTYGTPDPVVTLSGIINGDSVLPLATVTGVSGTQTMTDTGSGYAFDDHLAAGTRTYTLTGVGGAQSYNYVLDMSGMVSEALNIAPKTLTYAGSGGNATSTYGTLANLDLSLNGVLSGDDVSAAATVTGTGGAVTLAARTPAGTYTVSPNGLTGAQAANYSINNASNFTLTVNPLAITYTAPSGTVNYGTAFGGAISLPGVLSGDDVTVALGIKSGGTTSTYDNHANAATYQTVPILGGAAAGNYNVTGTPGSLIIAPLPLDYVLHDGSIAYGSGAAPTVDLSGILFGDDVFATVGTNAPGGLSATTSVGSYVASVAGLSGAKAGNYTLGSGNATSTLTISPKALGISSSGSSVIYGANAQANVTLSGLVTTGDAIAIHPQLSITDSGGNVVTASLDTSSLGATIASLGILDAGTYTVSVTGIISSDGAHPVSNYSFAPTTGQPITVAKRTLLAAIGDTPYSIAYGSTVAFGLGITLSNFAPGDFGIGHYTMVDSLGHAVALGNPQDYGLGVSGSALIAGTNAGTYTVSVDTASFVTQGGVKLSNYIIGNSPSTTLTVTPKALNWTVNDFTSTYGTLAAPVTSLRNVFGSDDVYINNFALTDGLGNPVAFSDRVMGSSSYTISAAGLGGAKAANYTLANTGVNLAGTLTVNPKLVTWSVADTTDVYGSANALRDIGAVTLTGVLSGDTLGTVSGFYGANGPGNPQPTIDTTTPAGDYKMYVTAITGNNAALHNYTIGNVVANHVGTFTVTPAPLSVTVVDQAVTYGTAFTGSSTQISAGVLYNGDTVQIDNYFLPDPGLGDVGDYTITASAHQNPNYTITVVPGTLHIAPLPLKYTVPDISWVYGSQTDSISGYTPQATFLRDDTGASAGLPADFYTTGIQRGGQAVTLSARSDVGNYSLVATLNNANYTIVTADSHPGTLTITPRTVTLLPATSVYGSMPVFALGDVMQGDSLTVLNATATGTTGVAYSPDLIWNPSGTFRGNPNPLPVDSYTLTGGSLAALGGTNIFNYVLAPITAKLTVTPKPITITAMTRANVTYGDGLLDSGGSPSGFLGQIDPKNQRLVFDGTTTYSGLVVAADANAIAPYMLGFSTLDGVGTRTWLSDGVSILASKAGTSCTKVGCINLNYTLANPGIVNAAVTVLPKAITYKVDNASGVYGTATPVTITLSGIVPATRPDGSPVIGIYDPDTFSIRAGFGSGTLVDATSSGTLTYSLQASSTTPAGKAILDLTNLTGSLGANYVFIEDRGASTGVLTVAPKPITFTTAGATAYRGFGAIAGSLDHLGDYTLSGLLPGDIVGVTMALDAGDTPTTRATVRYYKLSDAVNVMPGEYLVVVTSLVGPQGGNYVVAAAGNSPGTLTSVDLQGDLNALTFVGAQDVGSNVLNAASAVRAEESRAGNTLAPTTSIDLSGITNTLTGYVTPPTTGTLASIDLYSLATPTTATYLQAPPVAPPAPAPPALPSGSSGLTTSTDTSTDVSAGCSSSGGCIFVTPVGVTATGSAGAQACAAGGSVCADGNASYNVRNVAAPTGVSVNDSVTAGVTNTASENCGAGTCTQTAHVDVSLGVSASGGVIMTSNSVDITEGATATAGITFNASNGISGEYGSIDSTVGTTLGGIGGSIGASGSFDNGTLKLGLSFSIDVGIGLDVSLNFGINTGAFDNFFNGSNTTYTYFTDPGAARDREYSAIQLVQRAQGLAERERDFVSDVLAGKYNANPSNIAYMAQSFKNEQIGLNNAVASQNFGMTRNADGSYAIQDKKPPATYNVTVHNDGLLDVLNF